MFYGIVESESLHNPRVLNTLTAKKVVKEFQPNAETKYWHIFVLKVSDDEIVSVAEDIASEIKNGWYAIFWSGAKVYVVFSRKIFELRKEAHWQSAEYEAVREYGNKNGVQKEYLDFNKNFAQYHKLTEDK